MYASQLIIVVQFFCVYPVSLRNHSTVIEWHDPDCRWLYSLDYYVVLFIITFVFVFLELHGGVNLLRLPSCRWFSPRVLFDGDPTYHPFGKLLLRGGWYCNGNHLVDVSTTFSDAFHFD